MTWEAKIKKKGQGKRTKKQDGDAASAQRKAQELTAEETYSPGVAEEQPGKQDLPPTLQVATMSGVAAVVTTASQKTALDPTCAIPQPEDAQLPELWTEACLAFARMRAENIQMYINLDISLEFNWEHYEELISPQP